MKKLILIPITLTALTPSISLVGCGNPDKPVPPEPESWEVTEQEFEDAIRYVNEDYAQVDSHIKYFDQESGEVGEETRNLRILSPEAYFFQISDESDGILRPESESYVIKNDDDTYTEHSRKLMLSEDPRWTIDDDSHNFKSIEDIGDENYYIYQSFKTLEVPILPDEVNKCYTASFEGQPTGEHFIYSYYFENKKLVKMEVDSVFSKDDPLIKTVEYIKYQEITPNVPDAYSYLLENNQTYEGIPILSIGDVSIDAANEYYFDIECDKATTATEWDSEYSYFKFYDDTGNDITDLDFVILYYSYGTKGQTLSPLYHVLPEQLESECYYCDGCMACAQMPEDISNNKVMQVLVKFNNHNGDNIKIKWSNQLLQ